MYQINNKDFKILAKYKEFMVKVEDILDNVPRKDYKDKMRIVMDELLKLIFMSSYEMDKSRLNEYFVEVKSNIALIDFMLDRLHIKRYVNEKALYKVGINLVEINKMVTSWLKGLEDKL